MFSFNRENVDWLADHLLGVTVETRGGALSSTPKMEVFLRSLSIFNKAWYNINVRRKTERQSMERSNSTMVRKKNERTTRDEVGR